MPVNVCQHIFASFEKLIGWSHLSLTWVSINIQHCTQRKYNMCVLRLFCTVGLRGGEWMLQSSYLLFITHSVLYFLVVLKSSSLPAPFLEANFLL